MMVQNVVAKKVKVEEKPLKICNMKPTSKWILDCNVGDFLWWPQTHTATAPI